MEPFHRDLWEAEFPALADYTCWMQARRYANNATMARTWLRPELDKLRLVAPPLAAWVRLTVEIPDVQKIVGFLTYDQRRVLRDLAEDRYGGDVGEWEEDLAPYGLRALGLQDSGLGVTDLGEIAAWIAGKTWGTELYVP